MNFQVLFDGRSSLVKGACGVGLGFSCQDLLTRVETSVPSTVMKETEKIPESELLGRIITALALGSCIALPTIVAFCQRMELMDDAELEHIVIAYKELISELISVKKSGILHHSMLMASCAGAGTVLSCILNEGVYSIEAEHVKCLLELFRKCYVNPLPSLVHLGGMLGVVNAIGAGAEILVHMNFHKCTRKSDYQKVIYLFDKN